MSFRDFSASHRTSRKHARRAKNAIAARGGRMAYLAEPLESRLLLADTSAVLQMFDASPAVFVENQGQWADASIRYAFNGSGGQCGVHGPGCGVSTLS